MDQIINRRLGLHFRVQSSILSLIDRAQELQLPFFQCFFVKQESGMLIDLSSTEVHKFLRLRRAYFQNLFCHGSYWINLASLQNNGYYSLQREMYLAQRLEFTHFILHPGVAKGASEKNEGIDVLARCLNRILKEQSDIMILLENTSHGKLTIGSDITDFKFLLEKIDVPERIGFCIDTAHAHSYGYLIIRNNDQDTFINFLDSTIGLSQVKLLHINDTAEKRGSRIDRHAIPGDGEIGIDALKRFVMHPRLKSLPFILELPDISFEQEKVILNSVRNWK